MSGVAPAELRRELARECAHWATASERLADPDLVAAPAAWSGLEHYLGVSLRASLAAVVARVRRLARELERAVATSDAPDLRALQRRLLELRQAYARAETSVDFYADALATRASPRVGALLRACDHIATRAMAEALTPMGRQVPAALTYLDKGNGASVLKAGLRLWDGTEQNPVATIKITRHNLLRPSAIIHEAGHQVAHQLGWVPELAARLASVLEPPELARMWAAWSSEIAADGYAHVHMGYAATAALHDVLDGPDATVFQFLPGDPHPVAWVRVHMVIDMCRSTFGEGPWDGLAATWEAKHPLERCPSDLRPLLARARESMRRITDAVLRAPYRAFGGRPLTGVIDPARVSPAALEALARDAGGAAFRSAYVGWNEAVRLTALNGYRAALGAEELRQATAAQEQWMLRLGALQANQAA